MGARRASRTSDLDDPMTHNFFVSDPLLQIRSEAEFAPPTLASFPTPSYYRPSPPSFRVSTPSPTSLSPGSTDIKGKGPCVCFCCGSPYHLKRQCPKRDTICYTCGKMGHIQKMCHEGADQRMERTPTPMETAYLNQSVTLAGFLMICLACCPSI